MFPDPAVLIILVSILYYNYIISRNLALKDAQNDVQKLTELTVARIENVLLNVENFPENLSAVIENKDTVRFVGTRKVIETALKRAPLIYGASIAFAPRLIDGDTIYYAPYIYKSGDSIAFKNLADNDYDYTSKAWYTNAKKKAIGVWSEPYYDHGGGDMLMATYSVPFYYERGKIGEKNFAGVVTADITLTDLQNIIREIQFLNSGTGFLISSQGNVVTYDEIDTDTLEDKIVYNVFRDGSTQEFIQVFERMVRGEKDVIALRGMGVEKARDRWVSFAKVPANDWSLGILFEEHELYVGIHELYLKLIAIGLAGFLILGFLIFIIAGKFVKPIEKLAFATRRIGAGEFDFQIPSFKSQDEISQLGKSFSIMQLELKDYIKNLQQTTALKEKMESELEIANNIQQQMLPKASAMGGSNKIGYFGILKPAKSVGGDLYDFILKEDQLYFAIGDVAGKGIPAALFMAKTLTLFRAKVESGRSPSRIASEINNELDKYNDQSMFVTFIIGKLNMKTGELIYTNAGHNPPFIIDSKGGVDEMRGTHGIPLGGMPDVSYNESSRSFLSGDKIVLYTDGITEAENISHELYSEARLASLLKSNSERSPEELGGLILSDVDKFAGVAEQFDDITLLILEYK